MADPRHRELKGVLSLGAQEKAGNSGLAAESILAVWHCGDNWKAFCVLWHTC